LKRSALIEAAVRNQGDGITKEEIGDVGVGDGVFSNSLEISWGLESFEGRAFVETASADEGN
jgi:hypothetical protein